MAQIESMIALGVKPVEVEDPLTIQQRRLTIGHLAQQNQMGQLALEDHQRETEDQRKLQQFYAQSGGDITKLRELAAGQVSTKAMMALDKALLDHRKTLAELGEKELANQKIHAERIAAGAQSILSAAPEARPELYAQARQQFIQEGHAKPMDLPEQYPGDEWLTLHANAGRTAQQIIEGIYKEREDKRAAEEATRKQGEYDATLPGKRADSIGKMWSAAAQAGAAITNQDEWTRFLAEQPEQVRNALPPMWSQKAAEWLQAKGMTANQQVDARLTADRDKKTADHYKAMEAEDIRNHNMVDRRAHEALLQSGGQQNMNAEGKLRDDYRTESKPFVTVRDAVQKIETAAKQGTGVSDIALVYGFMKALDPGSTVREGEYATAANAGGIDDRYRSLYNRVLKGEKVPENIRQQMVGEAQRAFVQAQRNQSKIDRYYGDLSKSYGLNPERVMTDYGSRQSGNMQGGGAPATVKMRAPNGQVSDVPADQVSHYEQRGAKRVQ